MEAVLQYSKKTYWDERFKSEIEYEWITGSSAFEHILLRHLRPEMRILHIGCGSSLLSMRLYELGFKNITNLDYSQVLIDSSRERFPEMEWVCDDMLGMEKIESNSFHIVIEKATLEALLVGEKSPWDPSDDALIMLEKVFSSISRVLKPGGLYFSISFTQPHFRVPALLREPTWGVDVEEIGEMFHFYVYTCRRDSRTSPALRDRFSTVAPQWRRSLVQPAAAQ